LAKVTKGQMPVIAALAEKLGMKLTKDDPDSGITKV